MADTKPNNDPLQMLVISSLHEQVDEVLLKDLGAWLNARPPMSNVEVAATLAFLLAEAVADMCETQSQVCAMSQSFGDYVHNTAHWSFKDQSEGETKQ